MSIFHANQNTTRRTSAACLWLSLLDPNKTHIQFFSHTKLHKNAVFVFRSVRFETTKMLLVSPNIFGYLLIFSCFFQVGKTPSSKQKDTLLFTWQLWRSIGRCWKVANKSWIPPVRISIKAQGSTAIKTSLTLRLSM